MSCEKEQIKKEIELLKKQQLQLREQIREVEKQERLKEKKRVDIASRLSNARLLDYIFPYYDNLFDSLCYRKCSGKVILRYWKNMPHNFETLRKLAHSITDYVVLSKRSDGYVDQKKVHRKLNQLDDIELDLVAQCADEIISVLYKYKMLCNQHQNIDYSEFLIERIENFEP